MTDTPETETMGDQGGLMKDQGVSSFTGGVLGSTCMSHAMPSQHQLAAFAIRQSAQLQHQTEKASDVRCRQ